MKARKTGFPRSRPQTQHPLSNMAMPVLMRDIRPHRAISSLMRTVAPVPQGLESLPGILAPRDAVHDGTPDGTVQAILIASRRLIASPGAASRRRCLPQFAGTDPAVNVVRQEPVLMVHKEKEGG